MAVKKFVVGCFTEENVLFDAVKKVRKSGYKMHDVYTPFPIHGLDKAMGLRDTSIHTAGFLYALFGTTSVLAFMTWSFTLDWPLNIGGKPHFALPAWIPITFEFTVLCSCVGMVITFCYLCQLAPFVKKHHFNLRSTDDQFTMVIEVTPKNDEADVVRFMNSLSAKNINVQNAETGWWLGTYDKDRKPFEGKSETVTA
jgi:hypothetical protein